MFSVKVVPWHGLGTKLEEAPSCDVAIQQAGLDWDVETQPVFANAMQLPELSVQDLIDGKPAPQEMVRNPGEFVPLPEAQVVRRRTDGSVLGVVGSRYVPVQNRDAFAFFDPLVQDGMAVLHTAGSLDGGRTVWILAQIGRERHIIGEDRIGQFLLLSMGHDGKRSVQISPTPIRVVCANTLGMADSGARKQMVKIAHTASAQVRMDQLQGFIKPYLADFETTTEMFRVLASSKVGAQEVDNYLMELFPDPEKEGASNAYARRVRETILKKFEGDLLGYDAIPVLYRDSYWTLYNAVTEYLDHDRGTDAGRLKSQWFGSGAQMAKQALALALK
jgi:phage/plasmid-like protein (TIGR03299 family)